MESGFQTKQEFLDRDYRKFCGLVAEHTGINLSEGKVDMVYRRFAPRIKKLGLRNFSEYCNEIQKGDADELLEFSNLITTNLTSFFRENHHFEYLANEYFSKLKQRNAPSKRIRIWSAGCSTGEEPYSIAMTLRESIPELDRWDARILATDLDTNCLERGRSGLYPQKTIEGVSEQRLKKWFSLNSRNPDLVTATAGKELKSLIRFNHLNLMKEWPFSGQFDIIFCRNVMIYFDKPTQQRLVKRFSQYQRRGDLLIIGHSENIGLITSDYTLIGHTIYERK